MPAELNCLGCHAVLVDVDGKERCDFVPASAVYEGEPLCPDCLDEALSCYSCGQFVYDNGETRQVFGRDGLDERTYCVDCAYDQCWYCEGCDTWLTSQHNGEVTANCGAEGCAPCMERHDENCDDCYYDPRDEYGDDDDCGGLVHNYSFKPEALLCPIYPDFNTRRYERELSAYVVSVPKISLARYGIELEVEATGAPLAEVVEFANAGLGASGHFYYKQDGSLRNGVEIVSHPLSLDAWRDFAPAFGSVLSGLSDLGVRAWSKSNCGLHVHVSRIAFSGRAHLVRFGWLFSLINKEDWVRVARRDVMYAQYRERREILGAVGFGRGQHFDAVNYCNTATVEVRIWRPSLAVGRVIGSIELVHLALEYTRDLTLSDVEHGALQFDAFASFVRGCGAEYPHALTILDGGNFEKVAL